MSQNKLSADEQSNKIKIFIFIDSFHIGGMHRQVLNLVKHLNKEIFEPIMCTQIPHGGLRPEFEQVGCKLYDLKWKRKLDLSTVYRLSQILDTEKPDIIFITQAQSLFYYRLARLFWHGKIVQIGSFRAFNFLNGHLKKCYRPLDNLFSRWLLKSSAHVVVNSIAMKDHYSRFIRNNKSNPIEVIYNGSDFNLPVTRPASAIRQELSIASDDFVIIMVARLDPWKDFATLLETAKIVVKTEARAKFIIVGSGSLGNELEQMISSMDLKENVLLLSEKNDIFNYVNASDISVLSTNGEGFSNSILESMALGKPVIATDIGGNSEVIGTDGILVPPKSPKRFADAILNLIGDEPLRNQIGQSAKKRIHQLCNIEKYVSSYEELFRRVTLKDSQNRHCKYKGQY